MRPKSDRSCEVDGCCYSDYYARGLCRYHYNRYRESDKFVKLETHRICVVDGCQKLIRIQGSYCDKHGARFLNHGSVELYTITCLICGNEVVGATSKQKTCSNDCGIEYRRKISRERNRRPEKREKRLAQRHLAYKKRRDEITKRRRELYHEKWDIYRSYSIRRRARKRMAAPTNGSTYTRIEVFERDKYFCQLCGFPTNPELKFPAQLYPTLDHIISLSKGGSDSVENLQTAHFACNSAKSNRPIGDYVMPQIIVDTFMA